MAQNFNEFGENLLISLLKKLYDNLNENLLSEYHKKFLTFDLVKEVKTDVFENISQETWEIINNFNCINIFDILKSFIEYINNEKYSQYQDLILIILVCYFSDMNNSIRQLVMRNVVPTFFNTNYSKNRGWLEVI